VVCLYYHKIIVTQFECGLLYSMSSSCLIVAWCHCCLLRSFALCYVLINCFIFKLFVLYLFLCFICFAISFLCSVFLYCLVYCFSSCI
jgi:hypothetical protein